MQRPTESLRRLKQGGVSLSNDYDLKLALEWVNELEQEEPQEEPREEPQGEPQGEPQRVKK